MAKVTKSKTSNFKFPKTLTGIQGLDDITTGGLPTHRPTLLLGNTGCGKIFLSALIPHRHQEQIMKKVQAWA